MITLISDIDGTLTGNSFGLKKFNDFMKKFREQFFLIYATGRNYNDYNKILNQEGIILPDAFIINAGADIYIKKSGVYLLEYSWHKIIDNNWDEEKIKQLLSNVNGIKLQEYIYKYKISYYVDEFKIKEIETDIFKILKENNIKAKVIFSSGIYLDILPENCDKAKAAIYLINKLNLQKDLTIVAGDSENDMDLFLNFSNGIIVANANENLKNKFVNGTFYISKTTGAEGVLEGIDYYLQKLQ
jgi:sucrose-6F-phosphate phosphohydrolase